MELTEGERVISEKLESMQDRITSNDLSGLNPKTEREYLMIMLPVEISMLKRLEKINGSPRRQGGIVGRPKGKKQKPQGYTGPEFPLCVLCGCEIVPEPGQKTEDAVLDHADSLAHQAYAGPKPKVSEYYSRATGRGILRLKRR